MMPNDENDENDENVCCIIFYDRVDSQVQGFTWIVVILWQKLLKKIEDYNKDFRLCKNALETTVAGGRGTGDVDADDVISQIEMQKSQYK